MVERYLTFKIDPSLTKSPTADQVKGVGDMVFGYMSLTQRTQDVATSRTATGAVVEPLSNESVLDDILADFTRQCLPHIKVIDHKQ